MKIDRYGRGWNDDVETCPECGQPDNCGDCNHNPLSPEDVDELGGLRYPAGGDDGVVRPEACPREGQIESFDAGWNAHKVGLGRRTVGVLSPDPGWALLGWDSRALVASRMEGAP